MKKFPVEFAYIAGGEKVRVGDHVSHEGERHEVTEIYRRGSPSWHTVRMTIQHAPDDRGGGRSVTIVRKDRLSRWEDSK